MSPVDRDPLAGVLPTRVAFAGHEEHAFRGLRVYADLAGSESLAGLIALAVTGRRLSPEDAAVLDDLAACWTIADPRIWPLKVVRLAASFGSALAGLAAGLLCIDSGLVGVWRSAPRAARFQVALRDALGDGPLDAGRALAAVDRLVPDGWVPGFGVPYRTRDERLPPLRRCLAARGRDGRPAWAFLERLAGLLGERRGLELNAAGAAAAVCLDLGIGPEDQPTLLLALGFHQFLANAHEGAAQAPALLRRLPDGAVAYVGRPPRLSPRAREATSDGREG